MTETNFGSVTYEFGDFRLEPARRLLTHLDGRRVELAGKAFDALAYLVEHAGTPVSRAELAGALWPRTIVEDNSLSKLIVALRRALGEGDDHRYVATLPGRGYQFITEVRRTRAPAHVEPARHEAATPPIDAARPTRRRYAVVGASLVIVLAAAGSVAWLGFSPAASRNVDRSEPLGMAVPTQLTAYAGYELAPSLSPDGESVAFSWDGQGGNRDLYVTRIGGSGRSQLTDAPEPDRFPAWSPSGADIAFLRQTGPASFDLMVVPAAGGPERRLRAIRISPTAVWASPALTWAHRSDAVIFTTRSSDDAAAPSHLYRLTLASGETEQLTAGDDVYDTSPAISADGRWLAFVRHESSAVHARGTLVVQSLTPEPAQGAIVVPVPATASGGTPAHIIHSPSWSQDGRYLTFVLGNDLFEWERGTQSTRLVYAGAGRLGGLTLAGDVPTLAMVRRGGRARAVIGSIEQSSDIFALPLAAGTHEAVGPPVPRFESSAGDVHPSYSRDGRVAFVSSRDGRINVWVASADTGDPQRVTDLQSPIVGFPRWSPDGRLIAFHARDGDVRQIYVVEPDTGVPQRIGAGCCAAWSRDGTNLYVTDLGAQSSVSRIRLADGQREPLFPGAFASLTADGATLVYGKFGETSLYARGTAGDLRNNPEELLVTDAAFPSATAATADGFFYIGYSAPSEPGQIRFYDSATRESRLIARTAAGVAEILSLSADGTQLLYSAQRESGADLWLLDFDESAR